MPNKTQPWFRANKGEALTNFVLKQQKAAILLITIHSTAKWTDDGTGLLRRGQCILPSHKEFGWTPKEYRWAKKILEDSGQASFVGLAGKGTIATITGNEFLDANIPLIEPPKQPKPEKVIKEVLVDKQIDLIDDAVLIELTPVVPKKKAKPASGTTLDWSALGVNDEQIDVIISIRKRRKAGLTQRIINTLAKQFNLARKKGWTTDEIIDEWEIRNWIAFKAEWVDDKPKKTNQRQEGRTTTTQSKESRDAELFSYIDKEK